MASNSNQTPSDAAAQSTESEFRRHYETTYGTTGRPYNFYSQAYRYGADLAVQKGSGDRPWSDVESAAQRGWMERYESDAGAPWDDVHEAVRYGWMRSGSR